MSRLTTFTMKCVRCKKPWTEEEGDKHHAPDYTPLCPKCGAPGYVVKVETVTG